VRISRAQWDELVAHAREEAPNECCGYFWSEDGVVKEVHRAVNERKSPYGYQLDSESHYELWKRGEAGFQVGSYHSHPRTPAEPSATDVNLAKNWPEYLYLIVSLDGEPTIRGWWMDERKPREEQIDVA
jgi:[CysO sulfur-carrier protein]-S-L-cysteine hydrolase